jgi:hypothetical protein
VGALLHFRAGYHPFVGKVGAGTGFASSETEDLEMVPQRHGRIYSQAPFKRSQELCL